MPSLFPFAIALAGLTTTQTTTQTTTPSPDVVADSSARVDVPTLPTDDTAIATPLRSGATSRAETVATGSYTIDTPIGVLINDPRTRAVLDRNLPGMSDDPNRAKFASLSLRQFQPLTGGQLTNALLAKTGRDLAAIHEAGEPTSRQRHHAKADTGQ